MKARLSLLATLVALGAAVPLDLGAQVASGQLGARPRPLTQITRTSPTDGQVGVDLDVTTEIQFSQPVDPNSVSMDSFMAASSGEPVEIQLTTSIDRRRVLITFPGFLPGDADIDVTVNGNVLRDVASQFVDADGNGQPGGALTFSFQTNPALPIPVQTGSALITGFVYRIDQNSGDVVPAVGASVVAVAFPAANGAPILGSANTAGDGYFELTTIAFTESMTFLVGMSIMGHTEAQEVVTILPGRCWRIEDAILQPLSPPVFVEASSGGMVMDLGDDVELEIPPGALGQDSVIQLTLLETDESLRTHLPTLTSSAGTFVDIAGVFGEVTSLPVTLRVPNIYDLPLGTEVPFGKVDHFTLEWSDLRELYGGMGSPPEDFVGVVVDDGSGGTEIEVQFDNFCNICTSYCLPFPNPGGGGGGPPPPPPPCPPGPGGTDGSSTITHHEGHLYESVRLPGFKERGRSFGLSLGYNSSGAFPSNTLSGVVDYNSTRPVERTQYEVSIEGLKVLAAYDFTENNQRPHGKYLWNGRDVSDQLLPTGSYFYQIHATSLNADTAVALPQFFGEGGDGPDVTVFTDISYPGLTPQRFLLVEGRTVLLNLTDSAYGAGWSIEQERRLYFDPDGCVVLVSGNGAVHLYAPDPDDPNLWISPPGDFSELAFNPADGSITRSLENGVVEHYDAGGLLLSVTDRFGESTQFTYVAGLLATVTSPTGFQYDLEYVGDKLSRIVDSAGRETLFEVDLAGDLVAITNAMGATRTFTYDTDHLLAEQQGARGDRSEYDFVSGRVVGNRAYDTDGTTLLRERFFSPGVLVGEMGSALAAGLGTIADPIPAVTEAVDTYTDGRGMTTTQYTDARGLLIRTIDPLGRETHYEYNGDDLISAAVWPDGSRSEFDYGSSGRTIARHERDPLGALYSTTQFEYESSYGLLDKFTDAEGVETELVHDVLGRVVLVIDNAGNQLTRFYEDPAHPSLVTRSTLSGGYEETVTFDLHGNLATVTDAIGRLTTFSHSVDNGRLDQVVDGNLDTTDLAYDEFGRIVSILGGSAVSVQFDHDESDCGCSTRNLTQVTFANGSFIRNEYDGLDRVVESVDQLGNSELFEYDAEGNLTMHTNRAGDIVSLTYDDAGQLLLEDVQGGDVAIFDYDSRGHLIEAQNSNVLLQYTRDFLGRITDQSVALSVPGLAVPRVSLLEYDYDLVGKRTSLTSEHGMHTYAYDNLNRLAQISDPWLHTFNYGYDTLSRLTSLTRSNGIVTEMTHDLFGQVLSRDHGDGQNPPLVSHAYSQYDGIGNLLEESHDSALGTLTRSHQYDVFRRLSSSESNVIYGESLEDVASTFDTANRLLSDGSSAFTHDIDGRLITEVDPGGVTTVYEYDARDRLVGLTQQSGPDTVLQASYVYDPLGRRVAKSVNDVWTLYEYDGDRIAQVLDGRGIPLWVFTHGPGRDDPLAMRDLTTDESYFYHRDRLGSVTALTDSAGAVVQQYVYDEFGNPLLVTNPALHQPYHFTGREWDRETGLYYYRARSYHPAHGRFLTEDPIGLGGGQPHLYAYVQNNPVNLVDPDGLRGGGAGGSGGGTPFTYPDPPPPPPASPGGGLGCIELGSFTICPGETPHAPADELPEVPDSGFPGTGGPVIDWGGGKAGFGVGFPDFDDFSKTPFACGFEFEF